MSIQALRERKNELARQANQLLAEKGEQTWSKEDQTKFDNLVDDAERTDKQIEAHQRVLNLQAEKAFNDVDKIDPSKQKNEREKGLELFLRKSFKDLAPEEMAAVRNTMSTSTGSQGGYTVQTEVASQFVDVLKDYAGMRRISERIATAMGNDMSFPSTDGTAEIGEIVTQNSAASAADAVFGTVPVNTVKFSSKIITIPIELLQDSQIDVVTLVQKRMRDRIGRIQNLKFSQGSGTGEPWGLSVAAAVGKTGTTGQTLTVIYDDLVDLVDSIDIAYLAEGPLTWNFSQALRKVVRKIKDTQGRPIWTPSYQAGIAGEFSDQLLGYPVNINNDMPVPAASAKSMSFGQHSKYLIRDAMDVTLFRFDDSAYMSKGQVGFLAWARAGGNLLDTAAVKTYQHSAT
jgi:HK97 family phage major capsid protein